MSDQRMIAAYEVNTWAVNNEIHQEVCSKFAGITEVVYHSVICLGDRQVREKLIELGWTPPPNN